MDEDVRRETAAIARGDRAAFERFYRRHVDRLLADARRATGRDESFGLDLVHDVMLRVIRSMPVLDSPGRVRAWLRRALLSCAVDRLRRESRRDARERRATNVRAPVGAPAPSDGDELDAAERLAWLRAELARLPRDDARLLYLRRGLGWTLSRVGALVGLTPSAVDGRVRRLERGLRDRAIDIFDEGTPT